MNDTSQPDDVERCLACGADLADSTERRVVPAVEDGRAVSRQFCDEACLAEWRE